MVEVRALFYLPYFYRFWYHDTLITYIRQDCNFNPSLISQFYFRNWKWKWQSRRHWFWNWWTRNPWSYFRWRFESIGWGIFWLEQDFFWKDICMKWATSVQCLFNFQKIFENKFFFYDWIFQVSWFSKMSNFHQSYCKWEQSY